jgi:hypothetical protein
MVCTTRLISVLSFASSILSQGMAVFTDRDGCQTLVAEEAGNEFPGDASHSKYLLESCA